MDFENLSAKPYAGKGDYYVQWRDGRFPDFEIAYYDGSSCIIQGVERSYETEDFFWGPKIRAPKIIDCHDGTLSKIMRVESSEIKIKE